MTPPDPTAPGLSFAIETDIGGLAVEAALTAPVTALIGPNGAGKSTLLRTLLGAVPLRRGHITLDGRVLADTTRRVSVPTAHRGLGYVPQDYGLFPHLSVAQHLDFAFACRGLPKAHRARETEAALAALHLGPLTARRPHELSGGERQRLALARALAAEPRVLLLDEPLAALDLTARQEIRAHLAKTLAAARVPALIVTHDPADAEALADQVIVLERGRITQQGPLAALQAAPATPFVAAFVASLTRAAPESGRRCPPLPFGPPDPPGPPGPPGPPDPHAPPGPFEVP
ncbi:MAG: ATP-binding cassette domain-containing protein [Deltaproteobacteria bacterium]|nr:ATP-binding cassette domain-containing protein [Deltaproteobacteria bacterium]